MRVPSPCSCQMSLLDGSPAPAVVVTVPRKVCSLLRSQALSMLLAKEGVMICWGRQSGAELQDVTGDVLLVIRQLDPHSWISICPSGSKHT